MSESKTRVLVVGLGNAGRDIHLPALERMDRVELCGLCDLNAEAGAKMSEQYGAPAYEDLDEALEKSAPTLTIIGTPPSSHADFCIKAMEAGSDVLCEKPFVSSLPEADRVIETSRKTGRKVALNHEFRSMPIFDALLKQVGKPEVGELSFVHVWQLMDLPPWVEPGWRGAMLERTLYEAGVHLVDYVMALFGEKPRRVSAMTSSCGASESDSDAVAVATLEFSGGRMANIVQDRLCKGETQYFEVRAQGSKASLRASFGGRARLSAGLYRDTKPHVRFDYGVSGMAWREVGNKRTFLARNPKLPAVVATHQLLERTLDAFRDGTEPPASAQIGRDSLEVIAACYLSARSGRHIDLESEETARELAKMQLGSQPDS